MKKRGKRIIACVLLVTTLMCGTMTVFAAECSHSTWLRVSRISLGDPYGYGSQMNHKRTELWNVKCASCGISALMTYDVTEGHNWYKYESIYHYEFSHDYRIYCSGCGENYVISIPCHNNGSHSTPW